jgi:hypothetical protein
MPWRPGTLSLTRVGWVSTLPMSGSFASVNSNMTLSNAEGRGVADVEREHALRATAHAGDQQGLPA